jgi:hypothetical protein
VGVTAVKTVKLSIPQARVLNEIRNGIQRPPTGYGRNTGRDCSAWWRTTTSLKNAGLVTVAFSEGVFFVRPVGAWFPRKPVSAWFPKKAAAK